MASKGVIVGGLRPSTVQQILQWIVSVIFMY